MNPRQKLFDYILKVAITNIVDTLIKDLEKINLEVIPEISPEFKANVESLTRLMVYQCLNQGLTMEETEAYLLQLIQASVKEPKK